MFGNAYERNQYVDRLMFSVIIDGPVKKYNRINKRIELSGVVYIRLLSFIRMHQKYWLEAVYTKSKK